MEFCGLNGQIDRRVDLPGAWIDKERHGNPSIVEPAYCLSRGGSMRQDVEAALGGDFLPAFGNERHLIRLDPAGDIDHLRCNRAFQIEFDLHRASQHLQIPVLDVASVLAEVHGDCIGTAQLGQGGGPHRIGLHRVSGLTDRGDVININAECGHALVQFLLQSALRIPVALIRPAAGISREAMHEDRARSERG
jgi:hypothetical protein